ncbi:hypothetical protein Agub_g9545 [Astrephomene gubernaculifera]|uniref:Uncharacterized protein n=1 Tax=Astrephomene gubernaculifera TaxID=47775 RepID=A0AAD3DVA6_9CHLO|nr:hypothetical protein Agub_g9545 [Astrephomene gubernaculifera]
MDYSEDTHGTLGFDVDHDESDEEVLPSSFQAGEAVFSVPLQVFVVKGLSKATIGFRPSVTCEGHLAEVSKTSTGYALKALGSDQQLSFKYEPPSPKFCRKLPKCVSYRLQLLHGSQFLYSLRGLPKTLRCQRTANAVEWGPVHVVFRRSADLDTFLATIRYVQVAEVAAAAAATSCATAAAGSQGESQQGADAAAASTTTSSALSAAHASPGSNSEQQQQLDGSPGEAAEVGGEGKEGGTATREGAAAAPTQEGEADPADPASASGLLWTEAAAALWMEAGEEAAGPSGAPAQAAPHSSSPTSSPSSSFPPAPNSSGSSPLPGSPDAPTAPPTANCAATPPPTTSSSSSLPCCCSSLASRFSSVFRGLQGLCFTTSPSCSSQTHPRTRLLLAVSAAAAAAAVSAGYLLALRRNRTATAW